MDIAIGGIVLLVVLLPGISFRKGFFSEEFSHQYTIKEFFGLLINTLYPSLIFYLFALSIVYGFSGYYYDFKVILGLFGSNDGEFSNSIEQVQRFSFQIILFQLGINILAFISGLVLKELFIKKSWDTKIKFFRYKNVWHYILSGRFIEFKRSMISLEQDKIQDTDLTFINALVDSQNVVFHVSGILVDYELGENGDLNLLYLRDVERFLVGSEADSELLYCHSHVLKYCSIIDLSVLFVKTEISDSGNMTYRKIE